MCQVWVSDTAGVGVGVMLAKQFNSEGKGEWGVGWGVCRGMYYQTIEQTQQTEGLTA